MNCLWNQMVLPRSTTSLRSSIINNNNRGLLSRYMSVIVLSDENAVKKFNAGNKKSILYFTAAWCPPCKVISPSYEDLSKSYANEIAFGKVDVDDNAESAGNFGISSVPTFILFHGNHIVSKFSGADRSKLETSILELKEKV